VTRRTLLALIVALGASSAAAQDVKTREVSRSVSVTYDLGVSMNLADGERTPALQRPYSAELVTEASPARLTCVNFTTNRPMTRFQVTVPELPEPRFFVWYYAAPGCVGSRIARSGVSCPTSCTVTDNALVALGQLSP